jgi:hypothetical protein
MYSNSAKAERSARQSISPDQTADAQPRQSPELSTSKGLQNILPAFDVAQQTALSNSGNIRSLWNSQHLLHEYCGKTLTDSNQGNNVVPVCPECQTSDLREVSNPFFISYEWQDAALAHPANTKDQHLQIFSDENWQDRFQTILNTVLKNLPRDSASSSAALHDSESLANALHKLADCLLHDNMVLTFNIYNSPERLSIQQPFRFQLNRLELLQKAVELAPKEPLYWFDLAVQSASLQLEPVAPTIDNAAPLKYNTSDCLRKALSLLPAIENQTSEIQQLSEQMLAEYAKSNPSKSWTLSQIDRMAQAQDYESISSFLEAHFSRQINPLGIQVDTLTPREYSQAFCALGQGLVHYRGQLREVQARLKQGSATEAELTQKTQQMQRFIQKVALALQHTVDFAKDGRIAWQPTDTECCENIFKLIRENISMERDLGHEITSYQTRPALIQQLADSATAHRDLILSDQTPFELGKTAHAELLAIQVAQGGLSFQELSTRYRDLLREGLVDGKSLSTLIGSRFYEMDSVYQRINADPRYLPSEKKSAIQYDANVYLASAAKELHEAHTRDGVDIEHIQMAYARLLHMHTQFAQLFGVEVKISMRSVIAQMQKVPGLNIDLMHIPHLLKVFKTDLLLPRPTSEIKLILTGLQNSHHGLLDKVNELVEWINQEAITLAQQPTGDRQPFQSHSRIRSTAKKITDAKSALEQLVDKFDKQIANPRSSQNPLVSAVKTLKEISKEFRDQIKPQVASLPFLQRQAALAMVADYEKHGLMPSNALSILYEAAKQKPSSSGGPADRSSAQQSSWRRGGDSTQTPARLPEEARAPQQRYRPPHARSAQDERSSGSWRS